jgi:type VI secretion system protein ImpH
MAAKGRGAEASLTTRLFEEPYSFDFFQAVRLLMRLSPGARVVGEPLALGAEVVRFRSQLSLTFPASAIHDLSQPRRPLDYGLHINEQPSFGDCPAYAMTVAFMGLTGPSGVLPRHYSELLLALDQKSERQLPEKDALRAWLDIFNHRLISLFYRAWEKYRFYLAYERGSHLGSEPDAFVRGLFSLVGLGTPGLRGRLRVTVSTQAPGPKPHKPLAEIDDLSLLFYGGALAHRPRCAQSLEALLADYFQLPVTVQQFQGQWLYLDRANRSHLRKTCKSRLGRDLVVGARVWDSQSKFRVRIGPVEYEQFLELLPDRRPSEPKKTFFLLCHLVRLYVGPEMDFDVQVVLVAEGVPGVKLTKGSGRSPRLGWNTWFRSGSRPRDPDDAIFDGQEVIWLAPRRGELS